MKNVNELKREACTAVGDFKVHKVQMYIKCTEEDAISLRKSLAQTVFDNFEFDKNNSVFGVTVVLDDQS